MLENTAWNGLAGRRVLVTGASSGIGAAVALAFAASGSLVAAHFNSGKAGIDELIATGSRTGGLEIAPIQADLSIPENGAILVERAVSLLGGLDILVNNAGSVVRRATFDELDDELFDETMNLNVRSVIYACKAAIPHLEKSGQSAIVNVGSIAGYDGGGPAWGHYAGAKAYVHNLTRHLARTLAPRQIRVNAIAPGVIDTPLHSATPRERMDAAAANNPMGRLGVPEDCVGPILFLASPASGYVTGQILHVNGGQYLA